MTTLIPKYDQGSSGAVNRPFDKKLQEYISVKDFGAVGDGTTDDTAAFQAFATAINGTNTVPGKSGYIPSGTYLVSSGITFQYCNVYGDGGGYWANARTIITKNNADTNSNFVIQIDFGSLTGVAVICPSNQVYTQIAYVPDAYSVTNGIIVGLASTVSDCKANNFVTGFNQSGSVSTVNYCRATTCGVGINCTGTDIFIEDNYINLCFVHGIAIAGTLFRLSNNRVEWCAHEGIYVSYGNGSIVGNQLDRNGASGVAIVGGNCYDINITGNNFIRNGAGGDGTYGRWGFSTPAGGAASGYWDTTVSGGFNSSHIYLNNPNGITIVGNSFFYYGDDANAGSISPRFNYYVTNVNNTTILGNTDAVGYFTNYGYYSGSGTLPAGSGYTIGKSGTNYLNDQLTAGDNANVNKLLGETYLNTGFAAEYPSRNLSTGAVQIAPGYVGYGYGSTPAFTASRAGSGDGAAYVGYTGTGTAVNAYPSFYISNAGIYYYGDGSVAPTAAFSPNGNSNIIFNKNLGFNPDNSVSLGLSYARSSVVYSATGAINTSDGNQKTVIGSLNEKEQAVAKAIKGLFKTFQFNDAIAKKGTSDARIHVGVIAQDVKASFEAQGLDATKYALFCSDTWYEGQVEKTDADGKTYSEKDISEIPKKGYIEKTQLGIRYEELLAFVISSL